MNRTHGWIVFVALLGAGCASTASAPVSESVAVAEPVEAVESAEPAAAEAAQLPLQIHWVRNSAEYRAIYEQTFRLAAAVVERRSAGKEPGSWAVAVDADETLISNSLQAKERAQGVSGPFEEVWDKWVQRREAPALPGAKSFLEHVRSLGGRVAVVTNRRAHHCPPTVDNLRALELPFDVILCRSDIGDKRPRWRSVEQGTTGEDLPPLEIVMWVGDNIHDFPGLDQELRFATGDAFSRFGDAFFVLPNPLYGSWEGNPQD